MNALKLLLALLLLSGCHAGSPPPPPPAAPLARADAAPAIHREMRGVWVASVSNIDWPSRPGLPVEEQKAELIALLDRAAEIGLNAVLLQVRPAADALYPSELEPWSEYLTGEMGTAPEPLYDPLALAVEEAHRRGLELHAWFNPYRARHPSARSSISESHISRARPDLVRVYGRHLWMDPGEPEVQDRTVAVVLDVVRRYDVDGIHLDDYFYPYKETDLRGDTIEFPDSASFARYRASGGTLGLHDWRRDNVDRLVERLYREIRAEKPRVRFGISPIGTWRPGHPALAGGWDAYGEIFADARKWLLEGWLDYFVPQIYWPIARPDLPFPVMLDWWTEQNPAGRHVWAGLIPDNVGSAGRGWPASEIVGQVFVTRAQEGASGHVHFSMRSLMPPSDSAGAEPRDSLVSLLLRGPYSHPALAPASPWLDVEPPAPPRASLGGGAGGAVLAVEPAGEEAWLWTVRARRGGRWETRIEPGWRRSIPLAGERPDLVLVSAVDRVGNESEPAVVRPPN